MTVDISQYLHSITRIDHHFTTVDNAFICPSQINDIWKWNTTPYQQSIQMIALTPIVLGLIYFVFSIIFTTIHCCKSIKKVNQEQKQQEPVQIRLLADSDVQNEEENTSVDIDEHELKAGARFSRYFLSFLSICIIIASICIGYQLNDTIIDVQTNWDASYKPYDTTIKYGHSIQNVLTSTFNQCEFIRNTNFPVQQCETALNITNEIETVITTSLTEIDKYMNDGNVVSWGDSAEIDIYRKYSIYVGLFILAFIAVIVLISTFCVQNSLLSAVLTLAMLLIWIISSWQFAFSVEVADICDHPQDAILQAVNVTNNENVDETTLQIVEYYIFCDPFHDNPLQQYLNDSYLNLVQMNDTINALYNGQLSEICNIVNETNWLVYYYNEILHELVNVQNTLKCDAVNGYLDNITNDLCIDGMMDWFLLYLLQGIVILLLIIRSYCICTKSEVNFEYGTKEPFMVNSNHYDVLVPGQDNYNHQNVNDNAKEQELTTYAS